MTANYIAFATVYMFMKGILVAFSFPTGNDKVTSSAFTKALYGQKTSTHHGKYVYRKRGILDDIPYRKLIRGVFVIQDKDKKQIIDFFERLSAEYYVRVVELTEEDCEIMGLVEDELK